MGTGGSDCSHNCRGNRILSNRCRWRADHSGGRGCTHSGGEESVYRMG